MLPHCPTPWAIRIWGGSMLEAKEESIHHVTCAAACSDPKGADFLNPTWSHTTNIITHCLSFLVVNQPQEYPHLPASSQIVSTPLEQKLSTFLFDWSQTWAQIGSFIWHRPPTWLPSAPPAAGVAAINPDVCYQNFSWQNLPTVIYLNRD